LSAGIDARLAQGLFAAALVHFGSGIPDSSGAARLESHTTQGPITCHSPPFGATRLAIPAAGAESDNTNLPRITPRPYIR
jgi:hypothetical protein